MYKFIKKFLFLLEPENAHNFVTKALKNLYKFPLTTHLIKIFYKVNDKTLEVNVLGLKFKNPVGLAAGFDKNGDYINEFSDFGFGFIEVGTVTPLPQPGNAKPRMFRLKTDEALINRMGFNNYGAAYLAEKLRKINRKGLIIGGNIGKNKDTPNDKAVDDYVKCFEIIYDVVDYFVVNVSSPNTPNLRSLQDKEPLKILLNTLQLINLKKPKIKPILLKIAPDLSFDQLDDIIEIVQETKIDGVIATNTTLSRDNLNSDQSLTNQQGGLSGKPLNRRSTEIIKYLSEKSNKSFVIIGVGGITSPEDAYEKLKAGASLVQIYTGFIYKGPRLITETLKYLKLKKYH